MPAGIDTPGFVEEEKEKPAVTRKIEESDEQISPEKCAEYLIAGESFFPFSSLPGHPSFLVPLSTPVTPLCLTIPSSQTPENTTRQRNGLTDHRCREGLLPIHIPPHRGIDQGGLEGFSTREQFTDGYSV